MRIVVSGVDGGQRFCENCGQVAVGGEILIMVMN